MGGYSLRDTKAGPITLKSAKDLNAHMKMKFRRDTEELDEKDLKVLLKERELEHQKKVGASSGEKYKEIEDLDKESDDEEDDDGDGSEEDSDEEDDTEELMRELEKIKQERQQEKDKQELEKEQEKQRMMEERAISGNPLIQQEFGVKRRWDDDVIFKNQSRGLF